MAKQAIKFTLITLDRNPDAAPVVTADGVSYDEANKVVIDDIAARGGKITYCNNVSKQQLSRRVFNLEKNIPARRTAHTKKGLDFECIESTQDDGSVKAYFIMLQSKVNSFDPNRLPPVSPLVQDEVDVADELDDLRELAAESVDACEAITDADVAERAYHQANEDYLACLAAAQGSNDPEKERELLAAADKLDAASDALDKVNEAAVQATIAAVMAPISAGAVQPEPEVAPAQPEPEVASAQSEPEVASAQSEPDCPLVWVSSKGHVMASIQGVMVDITASNPSSIAPALDPKVDRLAAQTWNEVIDNNRVSVLNLKIELQIILNSFNAGESAAPAQPEPEVTPAAAPAPAQPEPEVTPAAAPAPAQPEPEVTPAAAPAPAQPEPEVTPGQSVSRAEKDRGLLAIRQVLMVYRKYRDGIQQQTKCAYAGQQGVSSAEANQVSAKNFAREYAVSTIRQIASAAHISDELVAQIVKGIGYWATPCEKVNESIDLIDEIMQQR